MVDYGNIAARWRELAGENNWEGLLDPLDVDLRRVMIIYGEMIMATYEAFIAEKKSPHAGMCRYKRTDFFVKVEVSDPELYEISRYIYATARDDLPGKWFLKNLSREDSDRESNWMGYVAVATEKGVEKLGRRDIVVAWRGTQEALEWIADVEFVLTDAAPLIGAEWAQTHAKVHEGGMGLYTATDNNSRFCKDSARHQVLQEIEMLMKKYKHEETSITVIGHSLGATLTTLNSFDIVANNYNKISEYPEKRTPVTAFVFGSPRTGDKHFMELYHKLPDLHMLRTRNAPDKIPEFPLKGMFHGYHDIGKELRIDTRKSPYLKPHASEGGHHDLEVHMHGIAGWQGHDNEFTLVVDRDVALVNKYDDCLIDEHRVPSGWRVQHNKNMVKGPDGKWVLEDAEEGSNEEYW